MKANVSAARSPLCPALSLALALASCATPPGPAPTPPPPPAARLAPRPQPAPQPTQPADWRDARATTGDWRWSREGALSVARFGDPASGTRFSLVCDATAHLVTLRRAVAEPVSGPVPLAVTTSDERRVLDALPDSRGELAVSARLSASDPLLDAMAFSRGRFMIEMPGSPPLYLPSWAEVSRVIEDCR